MDKRARFNLFFLIFLGVVIFSGILIIQAYGATVEDEKITVEKDYSETIKLDSSDFLKEDFNSKYGVITLSDTKTKLKVAEYTLIKVEDSIIDSYAEGKVSVYSRGKLFENLTFKDEFGKFVSLRDAKYFIWTTEEYQVEDNIYEEICSDEKDKNGTSICSYEVVEYKNKTEYNSYWKEYKFEEVDIGDYKWRIEAKKDHPNQKIDFVPVSYGIDFSEWAWWDSDWLLKKSINISTAKATANNYSILLNISYDSDMQADFDDLRFVDSTETIELGYWIQNKSDGNYANVWISSNLTNSINNTFYMYYGNNAVSTTSDRNNAFVQYVTHGKTIATNGETKSGKVGLGVSPDVDIYVSSLKKVNLGTETTAYILTQGTQTTLTSASWSGTIATFTSPYALSSSSEYIFATDKGGSSRLYYRSAPGTRAFPMDENGLDFTFGLNWNGDESALYPEWTFMFMGATIGLNANPTIYFGAEERTNNAPTITTTHPTTNQNLTSQSVTFSILPKDGETSTGLWTAIYLNISGGWVMNATNTSAFNNTQTNITSVLPDGTYKWAGWVNDSSGSSAFSSNNTFFIDSTKPTITSPSNATITYLQGLSVDFDASDSGSEVNTSSWNVNDTTRFQINTTGGLTNKTILPAGTWIVNVSVKDNLGNQNYSMWQVTVNKNSDSCGVLFNVSSPVTYGTTFRVDTNCSSEYTLYRNGTIITNGSAQDLSAGTYNFTVIRTDQVNYSNIYEEKIFQVNKSATALSISGTTPIIYGTTSDFSGTNCPTQISCSMNETNKVFGVGTIRFNYSTAGNENYTDNWTIKDLVVNQNTEALYTLFNETSPIIYPDAFLVYSNASTDFKIYRNGTEVTNNSLQGLSAGTYNFTTIRTDQVNYSDVYEEQTFQINKAQLVGVLTANPSWLFVYGTTITVAYTEDNIGDDDVIYKIYRDGEDIGSGETILLGAGTYEYILNSTGGENYSSTAMINAKTLIINPVTDNCNVLFNDTSPITYGTIFRTDTNCTTAYNLYRNGTIITNGSAQDLSAGTYNFTVIRTDQVNYSNIYDEETFHINKAVLTGSLSSSAGTWNIPISIGSTNISYEETNIGDGDVNYTIYNNSFYILNNTQFNTCGTYSLVLNSTGGENYTANESISIETLIVDLVRPTITISSPTEGESYVSSYAFFNVTLNENGTCNYSLNSAANVSMTNINNLTFSDYIIISSAGDYNVRYYCSDLIGNPQISSVRNFTYYASSVPWSGGGSVEYVLDTSGSVLNSLVVKIDKNIYYDKTFEIKIQAKDISENNIEVDILEIDFIPDYDFEKSSLLLSLDTTYSQRVKIPLMEINSFIVNVTAIKSGKLLYYEEEITVSSYNIVESTQNKITGFATNSSTFIMNNWLQILLAIGGISIIAFILSAVSYMRKDGK